MSKFPNRVKVATAITSRSNLDLSCQHITTGNFMDYLVSKRMRLVPDQSVEVSHRLFSRVDPLEVPTYGDSTIRTRVFWVPYRTVMPAWNDFIEDTVHNYTNGSPSLVPYAHRIKNSTFVNFFTRTTDTVDHPAPSELSTNLDTCDFVVINSAGQAVGFNLTPYGSRALKLLQQCGYAINFNLYGATDSSNSTETYHSALPLLCIAKVYYDWYYQNQYINDDWAMSLDSMFNYDSTLDFAEAFHSNGWLDHIMRVITKVNYDSDYFVSAWDNPVGPTSGSMSSVDIPDVSMVNAGHYNTVKIDSDGTPYLNSTDASSALTSLGRNILSQYSLTALKSLTDYVKRKQIAGARVFDRYLAEFGITLESEMLKRSVYLTDYIQEVNVGDVTSTADTISDTDGDVRGSQLGSYAGKAISVGDFNTFSFDALEYGEIVVVSTIIPRTAYYQGQDKTTMSQTRMDFWLPEFDALGVQSLDTREVFVPMDSREQYPVGTTTYTKLNYNNYVFGFVPRYAECKRGVDMITGDFRLRSRDAGKDSWTTFRDLTPSFKSRGIAETKHDRTFTTGADSSQYNRLFYITDDTYDHFKIENTFNIKYSFPGKSLYDDYEFTDEDKAKKVAVDLQGVKAN